MTHDKQRDFVSYSSTNTPPVKTGSWRMVTPMFHERASPCTDLCPCAENIPEWMKLVTTRQFDAAWQELIKENPFPLICGRVCYRFCEKECNRVGIDDRVSINAVERFLGEYAITQKLKPAASTVAGLGGLRVAVIGGGPAGLSAAHFLARAGAAVTVFDEHKELGGVLRYGIPEYRMPKKLLRKEIANMVTGIGVTTALGVRIDTDLFARVRHDHDVVVVALGAHKEKKLFADEKQTGMMEGGLQFLSRVSSGTLKRFSKHVRRVCVIGGGNTAIDAARSALRLGASSVTIIYRRTEEEMPAHKDEIAVAKREGVQFVFLASPIAVQANLDGTQVVECNTMQLGEVDASGRRAVSPIAGQGQSIACDLAISAVGEESDDASVVPDEYRTKAGRVGCDERVVYVGDVLYGPRSVSEAIASGKLAAQRIIARATGNTHEVSPREVVGQHEIKFHYLMKRRKDPNILLERKLTQAQFRNFAETTVTMSKEMAAVESARCINCGTCIACDRCLNFCPDYAITKSVDGKYSIDLDYCKGCGLCADVCERSVVQYGKEDSNDQK